jgi:DNA invertase Pin-like site-specific DNA recombinase
MENCRLRPCNFPNARRASIALFEAGAAPGIVVVYKVDRLTRALADFAKMVELFDARGVSFVAVTQQFNTTTSMGRLTVNVLLSFAQFEREVTGERIRDKIVASKRKGMWMGGVPPVGYDVKERRLVVNPAEADTVRCIYRRYLELSGVRELRHDLCKRGIVSKIRISRNGVKSGGCRFSRGALYELLANPIYIGEIRHRLERHPGQHKAIVPRELWDEVQRSFRGKAIRDARVATRALATPLAGKVFDAEGEPLYAQGAGKRYRYYVSRSLVTGSVGNDRNAWRLPAPELERAVVIAAQQLLNDRPATLEALARSGLSSPDARGTLESAAALCRQLATAGLVSVTEYLDRVELCDDGMRVTLRLQIPVSQHGVKNHGLLSLTRFAPLTLKRRGVESRLIIDPGNEPPRKVDVALLKAVAQARTWFDELAGGSVHHSPRLPAGRVLPSATSSD